MLDKSVPTVNEVAQAAMVTEWLLKGAIILNVSKNVFLNGFSLTLITLFIVLLCLFFFVFFIFQIIHAQVQFS